MNLSHSTEAFLASRDDLPQDVVHNLQHAANSTFLATLASIARQPHLTEDVFLHFEPLSVDILVRWNNFTSWETISTLGRIIPLLPRLSGPALQLMCKDGNAVDLLECLPSIQLEGESLTSNAVRELLLGVMRLVAHDNAGYAQLMRPAKLQLYLSHPDRAVRYLAVRILCAFTGASDSSLEESLQRHLGDEEIEGQWEGKKIDYKFWPLWEEKRRNDFQSRVQTVREAAQDTAVSANTRLIRNEDFSPMVASLADTLFVEKSSMSVPSGDSPPLVSTPTAQRNLQRFANALQDPPPVLLSGLAGSGKTHLVNYVSSKLGHGSSLVTLHLNEQTDAKLLVGIYATGATPGSFEWRPGVLTTAVSEGRWVFIEDLDRAPNDVLSTILPLIERRQLLIPSRGEIVKAAPGFRLVATMRTHLDIHGNEVMPKPGMLGSRLWSKVWVEKLDIEELRQLVIAKHPVLEKFMPRLLAVHQTLEQSSFATSKSAKMPVSSREFLKWCDRISAHLQAAESIEDPSMVLEEALDAMFLDGIDCFSGHLEDRIQRASAAALIAQELHIDPQRRDHLLQDRVVRTKRTGEQMIIGRARIAGLDFSSKTSRTRHGTSSSPFAMNKHSLRLLERVALAVRQHEPVLLVGETGIGKTTVVQHLADLLGQKLIAINLSQQSESGDLLGGFKPVSIRSLAVPLKDEFDFLFERTFSNKKNQNFTLLLSKCIARGQWKRALSLWREALKMVDQALKRPNSIASAETSKDAKSVKRRKLASSVGEIDRENWNAFTIKLDTLESQISASTSQALMFSFTEGKLVQAVRDGHWVLLDEINLATPDTLECLSDLLERGPDSNGSLLLAETGSVERIVAHPAFRIFGAMNPSNDIGKKDLPPGIKSRFTELYVDSPDGDAQSLQSIVVAYLERASGSTPDVRLAKLVTEMYLEIQRIVQQDGLVDGSGQRPVFSLRTLTRALAYAVDTSSRSGIKRSLYEGFALCFFTCLDGLSEQKLQVLVKTKLFGALASASAELRKPIRQPEDAQNYTRVTLTIHSVEKSKKDREEKHWLPKGDAESLDPPQYIITEYIGKNLQNLIRAAATKKYPVLIQGPTSAGKTSMVEYLAQRSGNAFVRINNHEHTDLQEYLGTYVSTSEGQIIFQEGVLVEALRKGYWVVLDELNLAPTDVLEALNRLLDDNRELLIPETQEIVRPHPNFMLFATQNPAGPYGGRKALSRAFRNRFLELHFDDIPIDELQVILSKRANLPESRCALIVEVYKKLSQLRQQSRVFEQNSFATLRDLFRWAFRDNDSVEKLAANGYMLLAEKVRKPEERLEVKKVIETTMSRKGTKININDSQLYDANSCPPIDGVVWTKAMQRIYVLVAHAVKYGEPILLVGETGCGKTTVCQMLAHHLNKQLHTVNAHQNLETGDLIGAQRPTRNRHIFEAQLRSQLERALALASTPESVLASVTLEDLYIKYHQLDSDAIAALPAELKADIQILRGNLKTLFQWQDGTIVHAMQSGEFFLLDEISLAEDSVLERLNSVLDPQRTLLLAEKGSSDSLVVAKDGFQFFATMNPGGDYGKKELSPALRNRFTEIWVPPMADMEDVLQIVEQKLQPFAKQAATAVVSFGKWFEERFHSLKDSSISIRDMLAWIDFINASQLAIIPSIIHGASLVYIDTLGANPSALSALSSTRVDEERSECLTRLGELLGVDAHAIYSQPLNVKITDNDLIIGDFSIPTIGKIQLTGNFSFDAPTSRRNAMRIARGLQLSKPILLEGSPGVGKTSLVTALAQATGRVLTRLNLSEQTDLMDLFGSDVPVDGAEAGRFAWRDASFLAAMKSGGWVLLDEMNLASQSILEGLNACLDHRGEVYIPELDMTFKRHPDFRLFAAQNPHSQGGGRKGLPSSFVNRFTVVYADVLDMSDLLTICAEIFPNANPRMMTQLVDFVGTLDVNTAQLRKFGQRGAPWEFNLRDTLRCLQLLTAKKGLLTGAGLNACTDILFTQRFRTISDRRAVQSLSRDLLDTNVVPRSMTTNLSSSSLQVGLGLLERKQETLAENAMSSINASGRHEVLEAMMVCIQQSWPVLLVGAPATGKSRLIESLAATTGNRLEIFPLSADIDATDLVGGYEQVDNSRKLRRIARDTSDLSREILSQLICSGGKAKTSVLEDLGWVIAGQSRNMTLENASRLHQAVENISSTFTEKSNFHSLKTELELCMESFKENGAARFQWVDGSFVTALEQGYWLVLDNANLCSPSVLDRLNSVLEPNGSLILTEHCTSDGSPKIVTPHPNFRIFLTMDPHHGEISRAMRNRAVEIFLPEKDLLHISSTSSLLESSLTSFHDLTKMAQARPKPADRIVEAALEQVSYKDMRLLKRFLAQVQSGLLDSRDAIAYIRGCQNVLAATNIGKEWYRLPLDFYANTAAQLGYPDAFIHAQSLNTLGNESLVLSALKANGKHDPHLLSFIHETFLDLARMTQSLQSEHQAATQTHVQNERKSLTRLQRSFISKSSGKSLKESTSEVARFLVTSQAEVSTWIFETSMEALDAAEYHSWYSTFVFYWKIIFGMVSNDAFDEAKYLMVLSQAKMDLSTATAKSSSLSKLQRTVFELIRRLDPQIRPRTGLSMQVLWNIFRPSTPSDLDRHLSLMRLESIADRFDESVWRSSASLHDLSNLRRAIQQAMELLIERKVPVESLISDVESALEGVTEQKGRYQREPSFQATFRALFQTYSFFDASRTAGDELKASSLIGLLSNWPTRLSLRTSGNASSSAEYLRAISVYTGIEEDLATPLTNGHSIGKFALGQLIASTNVSIRSLDLFQSELDVLGRELSVNFQVLNVPHEQYLRQILEMLCDSVHEGHVKGHLASQWASGAHISPSQVGADHSFDYSTMKNKYLFFNSANPEQKLELTKWLVAVSIGLLYLYVPDRPYDPALPAIVAKELYNERYTALSDKLNTLRSLENLLTGNNENLRTEVLQTDMKSMEIAPESPQVPRPARSRIMELLPDFSGVLRILDRATEIRFSDSESIENVQTLVKDIYHAIDRLHHHLPVYRDITEPLVALLNGLRLGLASTSVNVDQEVCATDSSCEDLISSMPLLGNTKFHLSSGLRGTSGAQKHLFLSFRLEACVNGLQIAFSRAADSLTASFSFLFQKWKLQLEKDQEQNAQASRLYTYRGGADDIAEHDDNEFEELFPSYENPSDSHKAANDRILKEPRHLAVLAASLHIDIFASNSPMCDPLNALIENAGQTLYQLSNDTTCPQSNETMLFLSLISLHRKQRDFSKTSPKPSEYNVYVDTNITEVKAVFLLAQRVIKRMEAILDTWPEHATLHHIVNTCSEILSTSYTEPIMKIIQVVERLHAYLAEWQSVASREHSVHTLLDEVTKIIVSWRRLELSTWPHLLTLEANKSKDQAFEWWFPAYENVVHIPWVSDPAEIPADYIEGLLSSLEIFLTGSPIGQYGHRLTMLRSLLAHGTLLAGSHALFETVSISLSNLIHHYERFQTAVLQSITDGRQKLEKDLREIVQLASWKDTNIEALKQSSRNSHRKLFRVVKKFRELLAKPVGPILTPEVGVSTAIQVTEVANKTLMSPKIDEVCLSALAKTKEDLHTWSIRPLRYKHLDATLAMIQTKTRSLSAVIDAWSILDDLAENTQTLAEQLRKATPSVATEENASNIKHLTARKRRLLADTLKEVRRMGIVTNQSSTVLERQDTTAKVLAALPATKSQDQHLQYVLDLMPRARESLKDHSEDLTSADVSRCVGFLEGMLSLSMEQAAYLSQHIFHKKRLEDVSEQIKTLWEPEGLKCLPNSLVTEEFQSLFSWAGRMRPTIELSAQLLEAQSAFAPLDFSNTDLIVNLRRRKDQFADLQARYRLLKPSLPGTLTTEHDAVRIDLHTASRAFRAELDQWIIEFPQASTVLHRLRGWLKEETDEQTSFELENNVTNEHQDPEFDLTDFHTRLFKNLDLMLAAIQDVEKQETAIPTSSEDPGWLLQYYHAQRSILNAYQCKLILGRIQEIASSLGFIKDKGLFQSAAATLTSVMPIVKQYLNAYTTAIDRLEKSHHALTKMFYRFAKLYTVLSTSGFCKPADPSDGKDESSTEKLESGTGLGEGEGAENISKEIGEDEDLDELAQEEGGDANPDDQGDGNDDAVSIEGDMKNQANSGDAEDADEEQNDEKPGDDDATEDETDGAMGDDADAQGNEGQDNGDSNVDEGVGEVDDLEPSAIDEKMWDEAANNQLKEKEGKQDTKSKDENQTAASSEQKGAKQDEGEAAGNDGDGQDGELDDDEIDDFEEQDDAPQDEDGTAAPEMAESMDPNLKETEHLDLPEDMQLDGDKDDVKGEEDEEMFEDFPEDQVGADARGDTEPDESVAEDIDAPEQEGQDKKEAEDPDEQDDETLMDVTEQTNPTEGDDGNDDAAEQGTGGEQGISDRTQESMDQSAAEGKDDAEDPASDPQTSLSDSRGGKQSQAPSTKQQDAQDPNSESQSEDKPSKDQESFRKLGNILEQWHRQQREIQEASSTDQGQTEQQDIDMADADFEHLPNEETKPDTQALGATTQEEAKALEQDLALPSDDKQDDNKARQEFEADEAESETDDKLTEEQSDDQAMGATEGDASDPLRQRTRIGSPRPPPSMPMDVATSLEEDEVDPTSEQLSTLDLRQVLPPSEAHGSPQWATYESRTQALALGLTEQLRLILTPTLATKLRGDFRTGKRLNIKRIIPYIASSYKRDKIWMRRSVPSKRAYQILLCIDDSKSMAGTAADLAFETLALVGRALSMLEVGEIGVLSFGESISVAHPLGQPFTSASGEAVLAHFGFAQQRTDVRRLIAASIEQLGAARHAAASSAADLWQLQLVISDGICEDHEGIRRLLLRAQEERIMVVFVVVDAVAQGQAAAAGPQTSRSITDLEKVEFLQGLPGDDGTPGQMKVVRTKYLETFPFGYYIIVKDVSELPSVLSQALRQWFAEVAEQ